MIQITYTYVLPVQNGKITKISNGTTFLRDWSSDGRFIIGDNLVMISPNGITFTSSGRLGRELYSEHFTEQ